MDPRIGELMRNGRKVYYAFTYEIGYFEGTLAEVMKKLGLIVDESKPATKPPREKTLKLFEVTVTSEFPSYNETPGVLDIYAYDANNAIKRARQHMVDVVGHITKTDGRLYYKAKRKNEE